MAELTDCTDINPLNIAASGYYLAATPSSEYPFGFLPLPTLESVESSEDTAILRARVKDYEGELARFDLSDEVAAVFILDIPEPTGTSIIIQLPTRPETSFRVVVRSAHHPIDDYTLVWSYLDPEDGATTLDMPVLSDFSLRGTSEVIFDLVPWGSGNGEWAMVKRTAMARPGIERLLVLTAHTTLGAEHIGSTLYVDSSSGKNLTLPEEADVDLSIFPVGTKFSFVQYGTGAVTIVGDGAVSLTGASSATTAQYQTGTVQKVVSDEWFVSIP